MAWGRLEAGWGGVCRGRGEKVCSIQFKGCYDVGVQGGSMVSDQVSGMMQRGRGGEAWHLAGI